MNKQLQKLLLFGGLIIGGYAVYNHINSSKQIIPLPFTRKIAQQIKHQILIVSINFAEGSRGNLEKLSRESPTRDELIEYFRTRMVEIYNQKEGLILGKYNISKEKYKLSLQKYKNDTKIKVIQNQIIEMLDKCVNGITPDLTVDKRVKAAFGKPQLSKIYEEMSKMVLISLVSRLQREKQQNPSFDSNSDDQFKKVIRELNIYDKKVDYLKKKGFKQEWGCPNQNFLKLTESLKIEDPSFKQQMVRLEQAYEKCVDIAAQDPTAVSIEDINNYFVKKQEKKIEDKEEKKPQVVEEYRYETPLQQEEVMNLNTSTKSETEVHESKIEPAALDKTNENSKQQQVQQGAVGQQNQNKQQPKVEQVANVAAEQVKQPEENKQQNIQGEALPHQQKPAEEIKKQEQPNETHNVEESKQE